ncbi:MAG: tetratricopeptide repeat protein [Cyclobacteriaceae bacterium]|nr:tetratricopeptide repeat protein [Cyclobacteriaceae bacterium]
MKLFITLLLVLSPFTDLDKIAKVNKAKKEAKEAYLANDFQLAHDKYAYLIDSLGINEEAVLLDYAHTLYNLNDTTNAVNSYQALSESSNKSMASIADQQLGQVMFDKKQYEPALEHYKNALRKNPSNQDARYNYELLKKILQKQEEENKDQENQDQESKDQKDQDKENKEQEQKDQEKKDQEQKDKEQEQKDKQEKQDQEQKDQEKKDGEKDEEQKKKEEQKDKEQKDGEKSEEKEKEKPKPTPSDKLKEMNISEEKAKMILEAMKNNEVQYIQQNRRKATKKKNSDKPDW